MDYTLEEAHALVFANHTSPPSVVFDQVVDEVLGDMAGMADFEGNRIVISPSIEENDRGRFLDVYLHEAAHFLSPIGEGHGDRFWCICDALSRAYGDDETVANNSRQSWEDAWEYGGDE